MAVNCTVVFEKIKGYYLITHSSHTETFKSIQSFCGVVLGCVNKRKHHFLFLNYREMIDIKGMSFLVRSLELHASSFTLFCQYLYTKAAKTIESRMTKQLTTNKAYLTDV